MNKHTLGSKIKAFRRRSSKSQFQVEIEVGLSAGALSRIENNITNPDKETILKIARALNLNGVETASLFGIKIETDTLLNKLPHGFMQTYKT